MGLDMANKNVELMRGEPEIAVRKLAIPIMISMLLTALQINLYVVILQYLSLMTVKSVQLLEDNIKVIVRILPNLQLI